MRSEGPVSWDRVVSQIHARNGDNLEPPPDDKVRSLALAVRRDRYDVLPIGEYLGRLNARILGEALR